MLAMALTGVILGYAVPDRYCDRRLVLTVFDRAREKLSESVGNYCSKCPSQADVHSDVMSVETFMQQLHALNSSLETLAAIGGELRLRRDGLTGDSRVRALLQDVVYRVDPTVLDGINPSQAQAALGLIRTSFRQAMDLLENPERAPGWVYDDPVVLDSQGQVSRLIVRGIEAAAAHRADLASMLQQSGTFLDVGTGVGWLAIEAAQSWPALHVVGVDSWQPALDLAGRNLAQSALAERVEFRRQRIEELTDEAVFTLVWLPAPFIGEEAMNPQNLIIYTNTCSNWSELHHFNPKNRVRSTCCSSRIPRSFLDGI
jgi:2-polyprenyl-3-methyl-5-hydroxy-6-metoxy-1,4-benzoquinol methylase